MRQEISNHELLAASVHDVSTGAWREGCDKVLPWWGQTELFQASGGSKLLWTHIVWTDYYLSSSETLGYFLWAVLAREDGPEAAGRMCHYQECQQSFWVIINNMCTTARAVFVLQLAPCSGGTHCLPSSCIEINLFWSVYCTPTRNHRVLLPPRAGPGDLYFISLYLHLCRSAPLAAACRSQRSLPTVA